MVRNQTISAGRLGNIRADAYASITWTIVTRVLLGALPCMLALGTASPARSVALAAPPMNWEVMRVYVEDDLELIQRLASDNYSPVRMDRLETLLSEEQERRRGRSLDSTGVAEATYVATLDDQRIVSDFSRWELTGGSEQANVNLGGISLALGRSRGTPSEQRQLVDFCSFSIDGSLFVPYQSNAPEYWFGFSAKGQSDSRGLRFEFAVPAAPLSRLLLLVPVDRAVQSRDVVVQQISSPQDYLPGDWDATLPVQQFGAGESQWWLVHCSGKSTFELSIRKDQTRQSSWFEHALQTVRCDYRIATEQVDVSCRSTFAAGQPGLPIRLRLDKRLKVRGVLLDGDSVDWQSLPSLSGDAHLLELSKPTSADVAHTLMVQAVMVGNGLDAIELPELSVSAAYCVDGRTTVTASDDRLIYKLDTDGHRVELETPTGLAAAVMPAQTWNVRWLGGAPPINCYLAKRGSRWRLNSLTKLNLQSDWLTAASRIRLESNRPEKNELRLPIGQGWFVDSVQFAQSNDSTLQVAFNGSADGDEAEILVTWSGRPSRNLFELDVVAHRPELRRDDQSSLSCEALIQLPTEQHLDNYALETTGQYRAVVDTNLLRFQLQPRELPQWQQDLLTAEGNQWLFRGLQGRIPSISLRQSQGQFAANSTTSVRATQAGAAVSCAIEVIPQNGSLDTISVQLPEACPMNRWRWTLHTSGGSTGKPLRATPAVVAPRGDSQPSDATRSAGFGSAESAAQIVELLLPQPTVEPFLLLGRFEALPSDAAAGVGKAVSLAGDSTRQSLLAIPIASVLNASDARATLVLPDDLAILQAGGGLELLPPSMTAESATMRLLQQEDAGLDLNQSVLARLEANMPMHLSVGFSAQPTSGQPWIATEDIVHILQTGGQRTHHVLWSVESSGAVQLELELPQGWVVQELRRDAELVRNYQRRGSRLSIPVLGDRRTTVELTCTSLGRAATGWTANWWPVYGLTRPSLNAAVLQRSEVVRVPPLYLSLSSLNPLENTSRLLDRLRPSNLWRWLSPEAPVVAASRGGLFAVDLGLPSMSPTESVSNILVDPVDDAFLNWTTIDLVHATDGDREVMWLVNRAGLASFALTLVLLALALVKLFANRGAAGWWLTLLAATLLVILVPAYFLPFTQLLLLATGCACLLRFGLPMLLYRRGPAVARGSGGTRASSRFLGGGSAGIGGIVLFVLMPVERLAAQIDDTPMDRRGRSVINGTTDDSARSSVGSPLSNALPRAGGTINGKSELPSTIYPLLIPVDAEGQAGSYVYAPVQLQQLLENPGDEATRGQPPQIYSAEYRMRIRRNATTGEFLAQEVVVDLTVRFTDLSTELELPFDTTLNLSGGQVNGQELSVGGRLYQNYGTNVIVYQPLSVGVQQLQLRFDDLSPKRENGSLRLRFAVPQIATASLRLVADSQQDFQVESIGQVQRSMSGVFATIGPVREIDIAWLAEGERNGTAAAAPLRPTAETWVHVSGGEVIAACQLSFAGGLNPQRELTVLCDAGWEPVARNWGDFELLDSNVVTLGSQVSYTLRRRQSSGSRADAIVRVLMAPRQLNQVASLKIPFLALQGTTQPPRLVGWSTDGVAKWRPEDLGFWRELPESANVTWGPLRLSSSPPRYFQLPLGGFSSLLRRTNEEAADLVAESTQVQLGVEGERVLYVANFKQSKTTSEPIRVVVPLETEIESVLLDGSPAEYSLGDEAGRSVLLIRRAAGSQFVRSLEIKLWKQRVSEAFYPLPRIAVADAIADASIYQVLRGVGLSCDLAAENAEDINWTTVDVRPAELLAGLQASVGQTDLRNEYREDATLPVLYRLQPKEQSAPASTVLYLDRNADSWQMKFSAIWEAVNAPVDIAFLQIPAAARDAIDAGSIVRRIIPTGDASRLSVCMIPPEPIDGRVEIELRLPLLPSTAGQTVGVPAFSVVDAQDSERVVAVPKSIDGRVVRWSGVGAAKSESWLASLNSDLTAQYDFFELPESAQQLSWMADEAGVESTASIVLEQVTLTSVADGRLSGVVEYWIKPSQQFDLEIAVPKNCKVVGVENGRRSADWRVIGDERIAVLLQPSYLPVCIRIVLQWDVSQSQGAPANWRIDLPRALVDRGTASRGQSPPLPLPTTRAVQSQIEWLRPVVDMPSEAAGVEMATDTSPQSATDRPFRASRGLLRRAQAWSRLLASSASTAAKLSSDERRSWLRGWSPSTHGLALDVPINSDLSQAATTNTGSSSTSDSNTGSVVVTTSETTVGAVWSELCETLDLDEESLNGLEHSDFAPYTSTGATGANVDQLARGRGWYETIKASENTLTLAVEVPDRSLLPRLLAATLLLLAAGLTFILARRVANQYRTFTALNPWFYWLQLAVLSALVLPVLWPSFVLIVTAFGLAVGQYFDYRRRRRTLAQV